MPSLNSYFDPGKGNEEKVPSCSLAVGLAWLAAVDESVEEPVASIIKLLSLFLALEVVSSVVRQLNTQLSK
jgi:hypothetical protein